MSMQRIVFGAAIAALLAACGDRPAEPAVAPAQPLPDPAAPAEPAVPTRAVTTLAPTEGNAVSGELAFMLHNGGVHVSGQIAGLTPGAAHGFHIHETGDCSAPDGSSAGGHFNPTGVEHGRQSHGTHHLGDMDNLTGDDQGTASVDQHLEGVEIGTGSAVDIVGRSVIVHADPDDYESQPTGNAGARLACGVISVDG